MNERPCPGSRNAVATAAGDGGAARGRRPTTVELLERPDSVLTRSDLAQLGWPRRAIDAIYKGCPVIAVPGFSRAVISTPAYLEFVETWTYRGDKVRP